MRNAIIFLLLLTATICLAQSYLSVHDFGVEARVDTTVGFFGIGTYPGGQLLTFDFPNPTMLGNSNFIVMIDSTSYGLHTSPLAFTPPTSAILPAYQEPGYPIIIDSTNTIQSMWSVPDSSGGSDTIRISQCFTPFELDSRGLIKVTYTIQNLAMSAVSHYIALEHKWDIDINGVDDAPVAVPGVFADTNAVYDVDLGDRMPGTFIAAELGFSSPYGLVARGIINVLDAGLNPPDVFAFGDEFDLIPSNFSIGPSFSGGIYSSSAALIRWNDVLVAPGETWTIITYYGLGELTSIAETAPRPSDFSISARPNPFNSTCRIGIESGEWRVESVEVFDINGRRIDVIARRASPDEAISPNNRSSVPLDTRRDAVSINNCEFVWQPDAAIGSGVYLVRARVGEQTATRRVVYLK